METYLIGIEFQTTSLCKRFEKKKTDFMRFFDVQTFKNLGYLDKIWTCKKLDF